MESVRAAASSRLSWPVEFVGGCEFESAVEADTREVAALAPCHPSWFHGVNLATMICKMSAQATKHNSNKFSSIDRKAGVLLQCWGIFGLYRILKTSSRLPAGRMVESIEAAERVRVVVESDL
ncbi:hypothetical protein GQ600_23400 [Phytophthora cactorum]|nr:hypothetical protein GQ600_23400 [Phytophthora cactorum]